MEPQPRLALLAASSSHHQPAHDYEPEFFILALRCSWPSPDLIPRGTGSKMMLAARIARRSHVRVAKLLRSSRSGCTDCLLRIAESPVSACH